MNLVNGMEYNHLAAFFNRKDLMKIASKPSLNVEQRLTVMKALEIQKKRYA